jgi:hypothetical protein
MKQAVFWLSQYGASKFARVKAKLHALFLLSISFAQVSHLYSFSATATPARP